MGYRITERADAHRGPAVKSARATAEEGRAWIREERAKKSHAGRERDNDGAYRIIEHARKDRGPERRDGRSILEEGRAWIEEHKNDLDYQRRKLDEEDQAVARMAPDIATRRRELDEQDIHLAGIVARAERMERMRTLPASENDARDAIAYHEAGHAVVGYIEGIGVQSVHIDVSAQKAVGGLYRPRRSDTSARCDVAGYQATEMAGLAHVLPKRLDSSDYRRARGTGSDIPTAERDARYILRRYWPAVRALARELAWAGGIPGDDAERIIADALRS